jgi:hypothetical protein
MIQDPALMLFIIRTKPSASENRPAEVITGQALGLGK